MPASAEEKRILRDIIDAFYKAAGYHGWSGEVNESVAQVFGTMLCTAMRCSDALAWVPMPPAGPPTIAWFARSLGRTAVNRLLNLELSKTCARFVIWRWNSALRFASSNDITTGSLTSCVR